MKRKGKPRKILLLEPNYLNKYPPIGLMKLATYHKRLGDKVRFFKGDLGELSLEMRMRKCLTDLRRVDNSIKWETRIDYIETYLKSKQLLHLEIILLALNTKSSRDKAEKILRKSAYEVPKEEWDRIYIATLFTFYWKITIKTIEFAKQLTDDKNKIYVGGVMASLLKKEIEDATGIVPYSGLLDKPGILDPGNDLIIDELPLDYSILDEIDYQYPTESAYFTFMTKGCTRKCAFCSVPKLEPTYKERIGSIDKFIEVKNLYGEQRNLLLMDNNVLASPKFPEIVQEIKEMGFTKGATFIEPNQLEIAIRNLRTNLNDRAYLRRAFSLIHSVGKRLRGQTAIEYYSILNEYKLHDFILFNKSNLIKAYKKLGPIYEVHRRKVPSKRYVDFNQGTDARYVTEENMRLMSEIPIKPLRIAFDHIGIKNTYINAVELAAKFGISELSNYILFNFHDTPEDLYERLKINVELGKRLGVNIFSFPMKYVPLFGEEAKGRKHIGINWNRKYLRAIQSILNTTKGIVAPGYEFFQMAFGSSIEEFMEILLLPELYIRHRNYFEKNGMVEQWRDDFNALDVLQKSAAIELIKSNEFENIQALSNDITILRLLSHYQHGENSDARLRNVEVKKLRRKFNELVKKDRFMKLTLTYDFDGSMAATAG